MKVKLFNADLLLGTHGPFKKVEFRGKNLYGINGDSFVVVSTKRDGKWFSLDSDMPVTNFEIG